MNRTRPGDALKVRNLESSDIATIVSSFRRIGWRGKTTDLYESYLIEQNAGSRVVLVARMDKAFCGYVTVMWRSDYPPFFEPGIPEISDLNVLPEFRRRGIASRLLDEAERIAFERSDVVGIGFGVSADYGPAQRLYIERGYVPDGRGSFARGQFVPDDATVQVFDCVIHLTKGRRR